MANTMYWYSLAISSNSIFCNYDAYQTFGENIKTLILSIFNKQNFKNDT